MTDQNNSTEILKLTAEIVAAHVSNNTLSAAELPQLISQVHNSLSDTGKASSAEERPAPAVAVKKSVTPDYIVCLEDGKKLKMLKRHLKTSFDLTPEQYRERWGLPADYPMVAPNYAKRRSALAKEIGLGKRGRAGK
ncbi:MAG: MucR family transcriptional regulator [Alphaproteobacteria bacterium]|nr:MucR family transcriptional regulator [Alphaproteobacteria bacterium]MCZ6588272.1 MucR family transcriptional regulator [Alphaproteobacteria bacterium]MCZ6845948.1 MucR family transcriptional regulator [Alphaproteobacteria bacterium]